MRRLSMINGWPLASSVFNRRAMNDLKAIYT